MNRIFHIVLFLAFALESRGQLKGTVVNGETGEPLTAVAVLNIRSQQYAYTNRAGAFNLPAYKGDKISFSLPGFKTQERTVPAAIGAAEMHIEMFPISYQLEEFVFRPLYTPYQLDSIERQSTYQRALAREKGGSVMSPVTFLAERISKRSRQIFKFQESFDYWENQKFIESRYNADIVRQLTGLKGDTLAFFINENPMPYDFARVASDLEIKIWIREKFRAWKPSNPLRENKESRDSSRRKADSE